MKKSLLLLLSIVLLISCNSIKRHNSQVNNPISVQKLKKDVVSVNEGCIYSQ